MHGPFGELTRKIKIHVYKRSGKWYASGFAWIKPNDPYFKNEELRKDIDVTNDQLIRGALTNDNFFIAIEELDVAGTFVTRLIT